MDRRGAPTSAVPEGVFGRRGRKKPESDERQAKERHAKVAGEERDRHAFVKAVARGSQFFLKGGWGGFIDPNDRGHRLPFGPVSQGGIQSDSPLSAPDILTTIRFPLSPIGPV